MFCSPVDFLSPDYDLSLNLRNDILRIPLGLQFKVNDLQEEWCMDHLACFDETNKMIACLVLSQLPDLQVKMRQVAVSEECQGIGIGRFLVAYSEKFASRKGFKKMVLNARDTAIPFYEKNGYSKVGSSFTEVGIKHYKMVKTLQ